MRTRTARNLCPDSSLERIAAAPTIHSATPKVWSSVRHFQCRHGVGYRHRTISTAVAPSFTDKGTDAMSSMLRYQAINSENWTQG